MGVARRWKLAIACNYAAASAFLALTAAPLLESATIAPTAGVFLRTFVATLVPVATLTWAGQLAQRRGVGPQMLARAVWWSNLVIGTLIAVTFASSWQRVFGGAIALGCGGAILWSWQLGLRSEAEDESFTPVRFRGRLLIALVMAFADAQTLAFSALIGLGFAGQVLAPFVAAVVMAVAVWGLYRLRTWALLLNIAANFAIAYYALVGSLGVSQAVAATLAMTAMIQALLPVPILAAALGDTRAGRGSERLGDLAARGAIVAVGLLAVVGALGVGPRSGWLIAAAIADHRGLGSAARSADGSDLRGADFRGAHLGEFTVDLADLRDADFRGATGRVWVMRSDASNANFSEALLRGSSFYGSKLLGASLQGVDLADASFTETELRGADLSGANLRGADLEDAEFQGADFTGADLTFASLGELGREGLRGVKWRGASCPDGSRADALGCIGHEGTVDADTRDELIRHFDHLVAQCGATRERLFLDSRVRGRLSLGNRPLVQASRDLLGAGEAELRLRRAPDGTIAEIVIGSGRCRTVAFARTAEPARVESLF